VRVGADRRGVRLAVARHDEPLPLSCVYLLESVSAKDAPRLITMPDPDPRLLLRSTFVFSVRTPARLVRQLAVCAAIAQSVRVVSVEIPQRADYRAIAQLLLADAHSVSGRTR
jgi:hypothetical protein